MSTDASRLEASRLQDAQRLHPMTLFQRILVSLPGLVLLILPLWRAPRHEVWLSLVAVLLYGLVAMPLIVLQYFRFRYRITPKEIVIQSGVVTTRNRSIPIERIQNIEIEQSLLPRLFGTAKVKIETAGSAKTEGVIEYVALTEAHNIRHVIRAYQRQQQALPAAAAAEPPPGLAPGAAPEAGEAEEAPPRPAPAAALPALFSMDLRRVLLSGAFRFSLLYIVLIFSGLQYLDLAPEDILLWIERDGFRPLTEFAERSPWLLAAAGILSAALLAWLSGILVNLNRYYGFRLWLEEGKLHKRHGLLTLSEGTIPLQKVQALILRSNPLMRRFGWWRLELQTMGLDVEQQGYQVAAPFARLDEIMAVMPHIRPLALPTAFQPVSRRTIRRAFVPSAAALLLATGAAASYWRPALWALAALPLVFYLAVLRYRRLGYAVEDDLLFIRRGLFRSYLWVLPADRFQVFYLEATVFQRRLGLKSLYVDTAGAGGLHYPVIPDLPAAEADALLQLLYERFTACFRPRRAGGAQAPDPALQRTGDAGDPA